MTEQENSKKVLIYFYYMSIMRQKDAADSSKAQRKAGICGKECIASSH